ncbi:hypothetical protein STSP2_02585 [Anaerohalosphaera lusitana]|uniref:HEAT repeat domain-containing protein n=1 Tax=Anaerohalosphaera lusitana TaxID=1936003 RepID=A0A1U9NPG2_9BACT|nr:HEAT repeat domain-containing protein [Anaerohalosphaera lusitana]AQT69396.1 hypothetical protein STSP2_02585 [Anaerohalosphaera lusitana]
MFAKKLSLVLFSIVILAGGTALAQEDIPRELKNNWTDFLHYARIGRFDLAEGYAQELIASDPDPLNVLAISEDNPQGYQLLLKLISTESALEEVSSQVLEIIEAGRYIRRTDPEIITQEIRRLSTTIRGRIAATERLQNAGEYAIPYMLDALADEGRKDEFANIVNALPKIGREAIRPLAAALQTDNMAVKMEIVRALGKIGYFQSVPYLKYVAENAASDQMRQLAVEMIKDIDPSAVKVSAAELFFQLGERYYYHNQSLAPSADYDFGNIWFWDEDQKKLVREEVAKDYFNELMAMRSCENSLKADDSFGKAISLWIASFFKAEGTGVDQPDYFGEGHADAITYAKTAGPKYLHQSLERALKDENAHVALYSVEALAASAGEKSLLYSLGVKQPLVEALSFSDMAVRYSAAIAIGSADPSEEFVGSKLIIENLSNAVDFEQGVDDLGDQLSRIYAMRAAKVMTRLAIAENKVVDLSKARPVLIKATNYDWPEMQTEAGRTLARLESPDAQRALATAALAQNNPMDVRISAFGSLAISAKKNGNLLEDGQIDDVYGLVSSKDADPDLRTAAASAYGALNLPSEKVTDLILDQARS